MLRAKSFVDVLLIDDWRDLARIRNAFLCHTTSEGLDCASIGSGVTVTPLETSSSVTLVDSCCEYAEDFF